MGNEENEDNIRRFVSLFKTAINNPYILVVCVASFTGISTDRAIDIIFPPRDDPYTGTMGDAETEARIDGDATLARGITVLREETTRELQAERENRIREKSELSARIQENKTTLASILSQVHSCNVETARYIRDITRNTEEIRELKKDIRK